LADKAQTLHILHSNPAKFEGIIIALNCPLLLYANI